MILNSILISMETELNHMKQFPPMYTFYKTYEFIHYNLVILLTDLYVDKVMTFFILEGFFFLFYFFSFLFACCCDD